ncbi:MAG: glycosyltransferase [Rubrivivax sp.]|nr:glycosyltransferase [Rubrivivax sp.]
MLVWEFAPAVAGGVYRPAALARYALRAGWDVTVVTAPAPTQPSQAGLDLLAYVGPGVRIIRFKPSGLVPSVRLFPRVDGSLVNALDMADGARRAFGGDLPARIVASGPPFCSHVAAMWLAGSSNRQVILECRDEWTSCPFDFVDTGGDNPRWESRCLQRADRVVVTTESQKRQMVARFGAAFVRSCTVVPNGWEPSESAGRDEVTAGAPPGQVVLTFAGKLGGHTDAGRFLQALARLLARRPEWKSCLRVRFVGAKRADAKRQLDTFEHPQVLDVMPVVPLAGRSAVARIERSVAVPRSAVRPLSAGEVVRICSLGATGIAVRRRWRIAPPGHREWARLVDTQRRRSGTGGGA